MVSPKTLRATAAGTHGAKADKATAESDDPPTAHRRAISEEQQKFVTDVGTVVHGFSVHPPTNAMLYTSAGSEALIEAAAAWNGLATGLSSAAHFVDAVASPGRPTFTAPAGPTNPVSSWLTAASGQAQGIAANRAVLLALTASNFFSGNVPAVVATEVLVAELWAQDASSFLSVHPA